MELALDRAGFFKGKGVTALTQSPISTDRRSTCFGEAAKLQWLLRMRPATSLTFGTSYTITKINLQ